MTVKLYTQAELMEEVRRIAAQISSGQREFEGVNTNSHNGLNILKYSRSAQYEGEWTITQQACRGLIIADNGEIVAVPFFKFFNWGQHDLKSGGDIKTITKKMDGSLGIVFHWNGKYQVATGGSFTSDQAIWATSFLNDNWVNYRQPENTTLMVEIIYPDNRFNGPVLDYGDTQDLVLLGARDHISGELYSRSQLVELANELGFTLVEQVDANNVSQLISWSGSVVDEEGWVVEFSDGSIFKFKTDSYFEMQKLCGDFSTKRVYEAWVAGDNAAIHSLPDELYSQADELIAGFEKSYNELLADVYATYNKVKSLSRKEAAIQIRDLSYKGAIFALLDGDTERATMLVKRLVTY